MNIEQINIANRENARRSDGKFGEQAHRETGTDGQLGLAAADQLGETLASYGLAFEDLPGLQAAWDERFSCLNEAPVEAPSAYLNRLLGDPDFGRQRGGPDLGWVSDLNQPVCEWAPDLQRTPGAQPFIVVHTRNGAGNREHDHPDGLGGPQVCLGCTTEALQEHRRYVADSDDWDDRTYATFFFAISDAEVAQVERLAAQEPQRRQQESARILLAGIEAGEVPPWRLLASADELRSHQTVRDLARRESEARPRRDAIDQRDLARATGELALLRGETPPQERFQPMAQLGTEFRTAEARQRRFEAIRASLPSLPAEVRDYLDEELPEETTVMRSGRGRNAKVTRHTWKPKTDFQRKEEVASSNFKRISERYREAEGQLTAKIDELSSALDLRASADARVAQAEAQLWAAGWPAQAGPVPKRRML